MLRLLLCSSSSCFFLLLSLFCFSRLHFSFRFFLYLFSRALIPSSKLLFRFCGRLLRLLLLEYWWALSCSCTKEEKSKKKEEISKIEKKYNRKFFCFSLTLYFLFFSFLQSDSADFFVFMFGFQRGDFQRTLKPIVVVIQTIFKNLKYKLIKCLFFWANLLNICWWCKWWIAVFFSSDRSLFNFMNVLKW